MVTAGRLAGILAPMTSTIPPAPWSWVRTMTAICAVFSLLQYVAWEPALVAPSIMMVLALVTTLAVVQGWRGTHTLPIGHWLVVVAALAGAGTLVAKSEFLRQSRPALVLGLLVFVVAALMAALAQKRAAGLAFAVLLLAYTVVALGDLSTIDVVIDVQALLEDGIDAALAGNSPYGITVPNLYNEVDTQRFYGPGVVENGRVMFGYPYLPAPLLLDIPAHLMGDVRWMHLLAIVGAGAVAWHLTSDGFGRACAVLVVVNPLSTTVLMAYWVEPVLVLLLAFSVWGMARGHRWTALALGLFFASKQYAVSYIPALWSVARSSGWRTVWAAVAVGGVVVGAFVVWDPAAFVHSTIEFHLKQPFRPESMSLLPGLDNQFGPLPEWLLAISPLVGLVVSLVIALRTKPGATAFALGVGLSLLVTVLLSKQAHLNYFFPVGVALLLAVITWDRDNPLPRSSGPR